MKLTKKVRTISRKVQYQAW